MQWLWALGKSQDPMLLASGRTRPSTVLESWWPLEPPEQALSLSGLGHPLNLFEPRHPHLYNGRHGPRVAEALTETMYAERLAQLAWRRPSAGGNDGSCPRRGFSEGLSFRGRLLQDAVWLLLVLNVPNLLLIIPGVSAK